MIRINNDGLHGIAITVLDHHLNKGTRKLLLKLPRDPGFTMMESRVPPSQYLLDHHLNRKQENYLFKGCPVIQVSQ
jgi:hypothetical protein